MTDGRREIFWGWYVVLGTFVVLAINYGVRYSFGVFVKPMAEEYQWSRTVISAAFSLMALVYGIAGIFTGKLIDGIAPRWLITFGALLTAAGLFLTVLITQPWQFFITYSLLVGTGTACFGVVVLNSSVGKWFVRKRGTAIGLSSVGVGAGTMVMAPLAGYVVKNHGWQAGFILLGVIVLLLGVILAQVLFRKTTPEDYGLLPDGDAAAEDGRKTPLPGGPRLDMTLDAVLRDFRFWLLVICYSLAVMAALSAIVHQVAYAQDRQIDKVAAASSLGLIGMASSFSRFFFGWLSDRLRDAKVAAALGFFVMVGGMILLLMTDSAPLLYAYALLFGFGYGSIATMMPFLLADRFGRQVLGRAYGMLTFFATGIGGSVGPVLTGRIYDLGGSYRPAWLLHLAVLILVTLLILLLRPRGAVANP
jgi:sugar phosphate permease